MAVRSRRVRVHVCILLFLPLTVGVASVRGKVLHVPPTTTTAPAVQGEVIVRGAWGASAGEFGRVDEASRPGPMDFSVTEDTLYVLDQVNARVQLFDLDGRFRKELAIGTQTADFLAVDDAGAVAVLDSFVRRELRVFSPGGELLSVAKMPGSIGLASALFLRGQSVWIEERHHRVHEVIAPRGMVRTPMRIEQTLAGRPLGEHKGTVHAHKESGNRVVIRSGIAGKADETLALVMPAAVASIVALESDAAGNVYVAVTCPRDPDGDQWHTDIVLVSVSPNGGITRSLSVPNQYVTDHYRKLCVSPSGSIIQMQTTEEGARFLRWGVVSSTAEEVAR